MVEKWTPEAGKVHFINRRTMLHILEGAGGIQVDFRNYHDWTDKLIFLEEGQYIRFLTGDFLVRKVVFDDAALFRNPDVRVLFKHLVSLGYIHFNACAECRKFLSGTLISAPVGEIIDISSEQWYWQNPFHANREEYHIIFDVKEIIDREYRSHLTNAGIAELIASSGLDAQVLVRDKIGLTVRALWGRKRLTESQKAVAFTERNIQEIAYEFGYRDPAYFSRVFRQNTGRTPLEFREEVGYEAPDPLIGELYALIREFHASHRQVDFYAERLHTSVKTLSRKAREQLSVSVGQLIRQAVLRSAKAMLTEGQPVREVAFALGFGEANHLSAFFRRYTGLSPSAYKAEKYRD